MEVEIEKMQQCLNYISFVKATGVIQLPNKIGEITFKEFQKQILEIAGSNNEHRTLKTMEALSSKKISELDEDECEDLLSVSEDITSKDVEFFMTEYVLQKEVLKRKDLGADHPDIQFMIKLLYENRMNTDDQNINISRKHFAKWVVIRMRKSMQVITYFHLVFSHQNQ